MPPMSQVSGNEVSAVTVGVAVESFIQQRSRRTPRVRTSGPQISDGSGRCGLTRRLVRLVLVPPAQAPPGGAPRQPPQPGGRTPPESSARVCHTAKYHWRRSFSNRQINVHTFRQPATRAFVSSGYRRLQAVTGGYRRLQAVTGGYRRLQAVTGDARLRLEHTDLLCCLLDERDLCATRPHSASGLRRRSARRRAVAAAARWASARAGVWATGERLRWHNEWPYGRPGGVLPGWKQGVLPPLLRLRRRHSSAGSSSATRPAAHLPLHLLLHAEPFVVQALALQLVVNLLPAPARGALGRREIRCRRSGRD